MGGSSEDTEESNKETKLPEKWRKGKSFQSLLQILRTKHDVVDGDLIGTGSYSVVLKAKKKGQTFALKIIDTRSGSTYVSKFLPREMAILSEVKHFNIALVPEIIHVDPFYVFVTDFCSGGDLLKKIIRLGRVPEQDSKGHIRQLIEALQYLKSKDIIHRDLKCENIFLDQHENVKLGDFGFARKLAPNETSSTFCGSRAYVAPEVLRAKEYTGSGTDLWSLGIVIYVTVTGVMPFNDENPEKMVEQQLQHKIRYPGRLRLSTEVKTVIYALLHPFPPLRPSYEKLLTFPWLKDTPYKILGPAPATRGKA